MLSRSMDESGPTGQADACPWCQSQGCFGECSPGRKAVPLIGPGDVRRGAACPRCDRYFFEGERYSTILFGFVDDVPITEVVCVPCGMAGERVGPRGA